ncbi:MAG TPA: DUF898 family protein [Flavobacteriales bacterium]|nr:DUF898 family protein [Flavobacteriales bacterium]
MFVTEPTKRLAFKGQGGDLFIVLVVNMLLTFITLGLYYPWAKARKLSWYYEHTELDGHPFHFHGKGNEMFKGFIKAIAILLAIYSVYFYGVFTKDPVIAFIGLLVMFVGLLFFIPLIIHGSFRYRSSRSSWRGVHFGYRGKLNELYRMCIRDGLLTLITFGIYGSWFAMNIRNYTLGNLRYGSSSFQYKGDGMDFFLMNLKGYFLTLFTLGIYAFWWQRDMFNYYVDNLSWNFQDGRKIQFKSTATGGGFFSLLVVNVLIVIFTLGIGFAWAEVRTMRFVMENILLAGDADLNAVVQTEQEHKDAMADDMGDLMDIGVFF